MQAQDLPKICKLFRPMEGRLETNPTIIWPDRETDIRNGHPQPVRSQSLLLPRPKPICVEENSQAISKKCISREAYPQKWNLKTHFLQGFLKKWKWISCNSARLSQKMELQNTFLARLPWVGELWWWWWWWWWWWVVRNARKSSN